ncbi:MAG: acyl-ACP--UDP-N-acetylglucosamine O-acyltransferase [Pirellulales bacterium]
MPIHPLAVISPAAKIAPDVQIGPFCVVEAGVAIAEGCRLAARVSVKADTVIGPNTEIGEGAVIGGMPQHLNRPAAPGGVLIGARNVIRENVTIHRAMERPHFTTIGNDCLLMVAAHVAHDCQIADNVILANNVMLGGHVRVDHRAYLGGGVAVHQFCRVGRLAMIGGMARIIQDVPPFVMIDGSSSLVVGMNRVGLKRAGFTPTEMQELKDAYRAVYRSGKLWCEILATLVQRFTSGVAADFEPFLRTTTRGITSERRTPPRATVRLMRDDSDLDVEADALDKRLVG